MISLVLACVVLLLLVGAALVWPLLRGRAQPVETAVFDRAVYRAQLAELDSDLARGLIAPAEAEQARTEIARRLLATERAEAPVRARAARPAPIAAAMAVVLVLGGGGMYLLRGAPGLRPDNAAAEMRRMVEAQAASAAAATQRNPKDVEAWLTYAAASTRLGHWQEAAEAYRKVLALRPEAKPVQGALGEVLTLEAGGTVTPEALAAFTADGESPLALFYLAVADAQAGDGKAAIGKFLALAGELPQDSPFRANIAARVAEAAKAAGIAPPALPQGKPAPDGAAMVARLAERMKTTPDDAEGWLRLGRAYLVLGEAGKSAEAYDRAAALRPGDAEARIQELAALIETTPLGRPLPERVGTVLSEVAAKAPDRPEVLWYQGLVAARAGDRAEALRRWQALLPKLPETSQERKLVQTAIDALNGH